MPQGAAVNDLYVGVGDARSSDLVALWASGRERAGNRRCTLGARQLPHPPTSGRCVVLKHEVDTLRAGSKRLAARSMFAVSPARRTGTPTSRDLGMHVRGMRSRWSTD